MAIQFSCPNGHKLSCPDDRAGRSGKCPKCGALFRVPGADGATAAVAAGGADASIAGGSSTGSGIGSGIGGSGIGGSGIGGSGIGGSKGSGGIGIGGSGIGDVGGSGIGPGSDTYPNFTGSGSGVVGGAAGSGTRVAANGGLSGSNLAGSGLSGSGLGGSGLSGSGLTGGGNVTLSSLGIAGGGAPGMPADVSGSGTMEVPGGSSNKITEQTGSSAAAGLVGGGQIVFLCPNGHKLNGPASLQGRPGKCPHCGAKFLIPDYSQDEDEDDDEIDSELEHELMGDDDGPQANAKAASASGTELPFDLDELRSLTGAAPTYRDDGHAMARLFSQLWRDKGLNGIVEIYIKGGGVVAPHWFAPRHSDESFGMFGMQDVDGSYSLAVVKWEAIERIAVRNLEDFPEGMFTEDGS